MQIFRTLAGYSLGRADIVRRAMSKKKKHVMEEEKKVFIYGLNDDNGNVIVDGCIRRGVPENIAEEIFAEMESFASYAFNKSHAACYAIISYQTAYLKYHYPCEYLAALLSSVLDNSGKIAVYIDECTRHNIKVLPPHVNKSDIGFAVHENEIRFGLMAIKNLGKGLIESVIAERRNGEYTSFFNFCKRLYGREMNRRALESLIKCGALDGLGANRCQMLLSCDVFLQYLNNTKNKNIEGQLDLFGISDTESNDNEPPLPNVQEFSVSELLEMEKQTAGLYLSGHPLAEYDEVIKSLDTDRLNDIINDEYNNYSDGRSVDILVIIDKIKMKTTKNSQRMAFVDIQDKYGSAELIVFPKILSEFGGLIQEGNVVRISATVSRREDEETKLLCNQVIYAPKEVSQIHSNPTTPTHSQKKGLYIRVPSEDSTEYIRAKQVIDIFDGNTPLYVYFTDTKKLWLAPVSMYVYPNDVMIKELKKRIGEKNVAVVS